MGDKFKPVRFTDLVINDSFWTPRQETNRKFTIPFIYRQLRQTGRIDAFRLDWKKGREPVPHVFWDSDVYKWVEAASYSLAVSPDPQVEACLEETVRLIVNAQQPDGYLNVHFTVVNPAKRWANLRDCHELYCAGHLMEAAVAHFQATGSRVLLDAAIRFADHIGRTFGSAPGQKPGYDGHEEIELALVKLYRATGDRRFLKQSSYFVEQRGKKPHFFDREALARGANPRDCRWASGGYAYYQAQLPVRKQKEAVGHAVRAVYLYSALADLAAEFNDRELLNVCRELYGSVCARRMYLTGGIGSGGDGERFTFDYDLPNEEAYAETCAAIGLVFWMHRMLRIDCDRRYADVLEKALYNGVLSGVALDGKSFFYQNPLASLNRRQPECSYFAAHRQSWFDCACCPSNLARLLASLGDYVYGQDEDGLAVHLFISGRARFNLKGRDVVLEQKGNYPWDGDIRFTFRLHSPLDFEFRVRIPGWCRKAQLSINGKKFAVSDRDLAKGYYSIRRCWKNQDKVELFLSLPVETIRSHPDVRQDNGLVALQRGPLVYCLEQTDNPGPLHRIIFSEETEFSCRFRRNLLGGVVAITGPAKMVETAGWDGGLYRPGREKCRKIRITAVPYYAWDNRQPGEMRVWFRAEG